MTSGNTPEGASERPGSTSGNIEPTAGDRSPVLPLEHAAALAAYQRSLRSAPLSAATRAKYASRVQGYLLWLATTNMHETDGTDGGDPLAEEPARDGAVRDWRVWAKTAGRLRPATINNTLAAIDDFYTRRGLGPATARREALPRRAPKALSQREVVRYLRAVEHCDSARDTVIALLPFYAGLRVSEVIGLDLDDVALSARKGALRVRGKGRDGGKLREIPLTRPELRTAMAGWLEQRPTWPGAEQSPALLLNRRGSRLSDRSARTIVTTLGHQSGLGEDDGGFGPHTLRHCFATQLLRGGADPVLVADLLGHTDLSTLKVYTQPNDDDRARALTLLTTDG